MNYLKTKKIKSGYSRKENEIIELKVKKTPSLLVTPYSRVDISLCSVIIYIMDFNPLKNYAYRTKQN